jgi:hypothetical protein
MNIRSTQKRFPQIMGIMCILFLLGCGGSGSSTGVKTAKEANKPRGGQTAVAIEGIDETKLNHWKHLSGYFLEFSKTTGGTFKDPFKPQLIRFVGKEDLLRQIRALEPELSTDSSERTPAERLSGPLQAAPLSEFKPVIILTGVTQPKVIIIAPNGDAHEVEEGQRVGSEGGQIVDITQYQVKYRLPGQTRGEEIVQSLRPSLLDKIAGRAKTLLQIRMAR